MPRRPYPHEPHRPEPGLFGLPIRDERRLLAASQWLAEAGPRTIAELILQATRNGLDLQDTLAAVDEYRERFPPELVRALAEPPWRRRTLHEVPGR
jgi:hypothetical protein